MSVDNYAIREVAERILYAAIANPDYKVVDDEYIVLVYKTAEQFVKYGAEHYPLNEELEDDVSSY